MGSILIRDTLGTAVSFPWKQLGVISESLSGRTMLSADSEVWEWDKENGEELDLLVFNVSLREGVGSCYIQSRQLVQTLSK